MNLLDRLEALPPDDFPDRVSRWRRRKGEDRDEWRERALTSLRNQPPKKDRRDRAAWRKRSPRCLRVAEEHMGLTQEEIERYGTLFPRMKNADRIVTTTERRQRTESAPTSESLLSLRSTLFLWVEDRFSVKRSEALCDLDCFFCPSARVLLCAAHNLSAAQEDGFDFSEVLTPQPQGDSDV